MCCSNAHGHLQWCIANTLKLDEMGMMHVTSMPPTGGVTLTLQLEATWVQDNQAGRTTKHVLIQWCWACTPGLHAIEQHYDLPIEAYACSFAHTHDDDALPHWVHMPRFSEPMQSLS